MFLFWRFSESWFTNRGSVSDTGLVRMGQRSQSTKHFITRFLACFSDCWIRSMSKNCTANLQDRPSVLPDRPNIPSRRCALCPKSWRIPWTFTAGGNWRVLIRPCTNWFRRLDAQRCSYLEIRHTGNVQRCPTIGLLVQWQNSWC